MDIIYVLILYLAILYMAKLLSEKTFVVFTIFLLNREYIPTNYLNM